MLPGRARDTRRARGGGMRGHDSFDGDVQRLRDCGRGGRHARAPRHHSLRSETGMIDESFHLTPLDVRRYDFGSALRGYDKQRVDQFREQVAEELERLTRLNQDLDGKAKSFHEQLRAFRERDKALNEALVSAQQLRAEIREQAEREAQLILREARAEGDRQLESTKADIRRLREHIESLDRVRRSYLAQMRSFCERQLG